MPRILVTNDDGYFSPGIAALAAALRNVGDVTVVAPLTEASAVGHALTLRRPLRVEEIAPSIYAVDGTPTDCVNVAIDKILTARPDIVVSGINHGLNVGDDVTYSGTVAGAFEAALLGYAGIAVSLERPESNFAPAAEIAAQVARLVLANGLPTRTFLNINVPKGEIKGIKTTVQAKRNHITKVDRRLDPRKRPYFWIEEAQDDWTPHDQSDRQAIRDGFASLTPLQPDLTDYKSLEIIEGFTKQIVTGVR